MCCLDFRRCAAILAPSRRHSHYLPLTMSILHCLLGEAIVISTRRGASMMHSSAPITLAAQRLGKRYNTRAMRTCPIHSYIQCEPSYHLASHPTLGHPPFLSLSQSKKSIPSQPSLFVALLPLDGNDLGELEVGGVVGQHARGLVG
jgi:hypothetical protein